MWVVLGWGREGLCCFFPPNSEFFRESRKRMLATSYLLPRDVQFSSSELKKEKQGRGRVGEDLYLGQGLDKKRQGLHF